MMKVKVDAPPRADETITWDKLKAKQHGSGVYSTKSSDSLFLPVGDRVVLYLSQHDLPQVAQEAAWSGDTFTRIAATITITDDGK
jgi:hypothetical protein